MTPLAKVWAAIITLIVVGGFVVVGVGLFMASTLNKLEENLERQDEVLKYLVDAEVSAQSDRDVLLDSDRNVQAVTDCIIAGATRPDFSLCVREQLEASVPSGP